MNPFYDVKWLQKCFSKTSCKNHIYGTSYKTTVNVMHKARLAKKLSTKAIYFYLCGTGSPFKGQHQNQIEFASKSL